jgi:hypothetical protein
LVGLDAPFLDQLFEGGTDYVNRCRNLDGFDLSQKLWQHWRSRSASIGPGDEFDLVDDSAEIIGLASCYEWSKDPFMPGATPPQDAPHAPVLK